MKHLILIFCFLFSFNLFATEKSDEVCFEEVNDIFKEFQPEFIELQSKLALYKTAWTTLVLNKANGGDLVTMEKEISNVAKKMEKALNESASFRNQHEKLLNYRPFVDRWETRQSSKLPEAVEFLAENVNSDEFYENVLNNVGDKEKVQEALQKYAVDFQTVKATELLHDLYKNDRSKDSYLLKITNQVSSALRGRDSSQVKDKAFFESMVQDYDSKLSLKKDELIKKLKEVCDEGQVLHIINEKIICPNLTPEDQMMTDLNQLLDFAPILDHINKDAQLADLKKEYLRVAPSRPVCEINLASDNLLFDFSSIPKNGDYKIYLPEVGEANAIESGSLTINKNAEGKFVFYNSKDEKEYLFTSDDLSKIKVGSSADSLLDCRIVGGKPQGKKWVNADTEKQKEKIAKGNPSRAKINSGNNSQIRSGSKPSENIAIKADTKYKPVSFAIVKNKMKNPNERTFKNTVTGGYKSEIQVDTEISRKFLKSLEKEKKALMELYELTNEEYNELSKIAFGILGNEYAFGDPAWYRKLKEKVPALVPIAKNASSTWDGFKDKVVGLVTLDVDKFVQGSTKQIVSGYKLGKNLDKLVISGVAGGMLPTDPVVKAKVARDVSSELIDISSNSRGLAQMKSIPDKIKQKYPNISKETLMKPDHAAIAVMGFLAQSKAQVMSSGKKYNEKIKNPNRPDVDKDYKYEPITEKNWTKYVHYIYMGSSSQLTEGKATPEKNQYYKNIKYWNQALVTSQLN